MTIEAAYPYTKQALLLMVSDHTVISVRHSAKHRRMV